MNVVITGGSRGIGAEAVRRFSALGHRVAFLYEKRHDAARAVAAETGAEAVCCDVADPAAVRAAFAALPEPDLLITCAGIAYAGLIQDTTDDQWQRIFDVNVGGVFHAVRAVVPGMVRRQRGCIRADSAKASSGASKEVMSVSAGAMATRSEYSSGRRFFRLYSPVSGSSQFMLWARK